MIATVDSLESLYIVAAMALTAAETHLRCVQHTLQLLQLLMVLYSSLRAVVNNWSAVLAFSTVPRVGSLAAVMISGNENLGLAGQTIE